MAELRNLGPASAQMLEAIGVVNRADLVRVGPVLAYRVLRDVRPSVSLNLLYAMHGALTGERWNSLSNATRTELKQQADEASQVPPSPAT